jgi:hypothetical protein
MEVPGFKNYILNVVARARLSHVEWRAAGFLSDINAPAHLWAEAPLAIDPRLPVVPNEIYNPSKDLDYK